MADSQVATVVIPCLVIQLNNQKFIQNEQIIGRTLDVPCRNSYPEEIGYWAVPIKDYGVFTTLEYILVIDNNGNAVPQPTFDSFLVFRVIDKLAKNTWWIYGTKDNFLNSCNTCCGAGSTPMPGIDGSVTLMVAPCQTFCDITAPNGKYRTVFGIPSILGPDAFFPVGSYNNVAFATASALGYTTVALLLTYLNSTWTQGGTITWSATSDGLTLFADGGALSDSICVAIFRIGPSS